MGDGGGGGGGQDCRILAILVKFYVKEDKYQKNYVKIFIP